MNNKESNIEKTDLNAFIHAVGSEIQQAQVRLITAANAQMLFHYWKMGNYILYYQNLYGWGSKIIKQLAKAIRFNYPEKKGYSERNLTYMCQFARTYPLSVLRSFIDTDVRLSVPNIQNVTNEVLKLNDKQFTQELTAQIQSVDCQSLEFTQEAPAQIQDVEKTVSAIYRMGIREIEKIFLNSPVARINWASQMVILDGSLPLGIGYWYMKQSVEMGWSSNVLKIQIETNLYTRQINNNNVNNFTATLPAPQSDLANYLLKDPYIFDLAGTKEVGNPCKVIRWLNPQYRLLPLEEKDIPEMQELFRSTVLHVNIRDYTKEEVEDWASCGDSVEHLKELLSHNHFIGAFDKANRMVGFSSMNKDGYLHSMFVHKDWQGKGVATQLLSEVERIAKQLGVVEITSEVSLTARPFFEKKGYEIVKIQKYRANKLELTNFIMRHKFL